MVSSLHGGKKEVQDQSIKNFLKTIKTFLCQNFLKKTMVSPSKRTLLTSFRNPDGSLNYTAAKTFLENKIPDENMATLEVKQDFPYLDKDQLDVHYKVIKRQGTKVRAVIKIKMKHKDKWCPLYMVAKRRCKTKVSKTSSRR